MSPQYEYRCTDCGRTIQDWRPHEERDRYTACRSCCGDMSREKTLAGWIVMPESGCARQQRTDR